MTGSQTVKDLVADSGLTFEVECVRSLPLLRVL